MPKRATAPEIETVPEARRRGRTGAKRDVSVSVRDQIIAAAIGLFAERGFHGVSIRDLYEATGFKTSSIYFAFKDKRAIYLATVEHVIRAANVGPMAALQSKGTGAQRLFRMIEAVAKVDLENVAMRKLASRQLLEADRESLGNISDVMAETFDLLLAAIAEATGQPSNFGQVVAIYGICTSAIEFAAHGGQMERDLTEIAKTPANLAHHAMRLVFPTVSPEDYLG